MGLHFHFKLAIVAAQLLLHILEIANAIGLPPAQLAGVSVTIPAIVDLRQFRHQRFGPIRPGKETRDMLTKMHFRYHMNYSPFATIVTVSRLAMIDKGSRMAHLVQQRLDQIHRMLS